ncbi:MAG TPA: peptidoglycan-associated lipoprotein Pal [Methylomirabilota bacterium]|nr:peptidoglycan-associated lipoprotein Pal [Methylomirabilota bacterium]
MTRRVDPKRLLVAGGLALALAGCATHRPGAGADAAGTGASDASASGLAAGGASADSASGVSGESAAVRAPGATMFPVLPSPKDFTEAAGLRDIYFDFDRSAFRPEDARILDANARWLQAHPGTLVLIEGHADERGTNEYNLALGESRARVTREQLVARGVAPSRITLVSYGEERPTCSQTAEACWAKNRRAHFLVKTPVTVSALQP